MNPNVSCCATRQEDATFGAQDEAYSYRWTGSCLAVLEYESADIRKAVLHALACSTETENPSRHDTTSVGRITMEDTLYTLPLPHNYTSSSESQTIQIHSSQKTIRH